MNTTKLSSVEEESEQCQWENCGGGRYCEKHSLESKGVSLPSVEEVVSHLPMFPDAEILMEDQLIDYDKYKVGEIATLLTKDRNQAYTSLVEGIEGMTYAMNVDEYLELVEKWEGKNYDQPFDDGYAQALKDIREKVVKPLYGKE